MTRSWWTRTALGVVAVLVLGAYAVGAMSTAADPPPRRTPIVLEGTGRDDGTEDRAGDRAGDRTPRDERPRVVPGPTLRPRPTPPPPPPTTQAPPPPAPEPAPVQTVRPELGDDPGDDDDDDDDDGDDDGDDD